MNAQELFHSDGNSAQVWYCSECRMVKSTQASAEQCCKKNDCRICGEPVDTPHWMVHPKCRKNEQIERAKKLEAWDGLVYLEGFGSEYFSGIEELLQAAFDEDVELPEYVFICKPIPFKTPDIEGLISECLEGHYEDAYDAIDSKSYTKLSIALDEFRMANQHIVSYEPDFTKMVLVREA